MITRHPAAIVIAITILGCGTAEQSHDQDATQSPRTLVPNNKRQVSSAQPNPSLTSPLPNRATESANQAKRTWDNFPLDVFFDDPAAQLEEEEPLTAAPSHEEVSPIEFPPRSQENLATDWSALLPANELLAEITDIHERLARHMEKLELYNSHYREIHDVAAVLAVLAEIVARSDQDVPWQHNAARIRDLASQLSRSADGLGPSHYDPAREHWQKLSALLDGRSRSVQGLDPNPVIEMPWSNVAELPPLMRRMERATEQEIRDSTASEAIFRRSADRVAREASIICALAQVIAHASDYSEEDEYRQLAADLQQQASDLARSAKERDYKKVTELLSATHDVCNRCHKEYRLNGDDF